MPRRAEGAVVRRSRKVSPADLPHSDRRPETRLDREAAHWVRSFRALGDATRARVVLALAAEELCVGDLAERLRTSSSVISHQLRVLRDLGLVRCRRTGRQAHYSLHEAALRRLFEDSLARVQAPLKTRRLSGRDARGNGGRGRV